MQQVWVGPKNLHVLLAGRMRALLLRPHLDQQGVEMQGPFLTIAKSKALGLYFSFLSM